MNKSVYRKIAFLLVFLMQAIITFAYDTEIDGVIYTYVRWNGPISGYGEAHVSGYSNNMPEKLTIPTFAKCETNRWGTQTRNCWVTEIKESVFKDCSKLKSVNTSIGIIRDQAFLNCASLKEAALGSSTVSSSAFENCSLLKKVSFIGSVSCNIDSRAFNGCASLDTIDIVTKVPDIKDDTFDESIYQKATVYVPDTEFDNLKNHAVWSKFQNIIPIHQVNIGVFGNGKVLYNGEILNSVKTEKDGSSVNLTFVPDNGYQLATLLVDGEDVTNQVINNQYTIQNITKSIYVTVSYHTIVLTISGNGYVKCNDVNEVGTEFSSEREIRDKTVSYYMNKGHSLNIYLIPDYRCRVRKITHNGEDITESVTNYWSTNNYNILHTDGNYYTSYETYDISFEKITHALTIQAYGKGSISYNDTIIREEKKTFQVEEGNSAIVSFQPDDGYRIKLVRFNDKNVTSDVINNQYTISGITSENSLVVEFEAIPYTLSIMSKGNGTVTYNGTTIRENTSSFTVVHGTSAEILFTPDDGYRVKSVKMNNTDISSSIVNNQYIINQICENTSLEVEFEKIYTYNVNVVVYGNGNVFCNNYTIRNQSRDFSVIKGESIVLELTPDIGCRLASVKVNNMDVIDQISDGKLTIANVSSNMSIVVSFEAIPPTTYSLLIAAVGNGSVTYNGMTVKEGSSSFNIVEGTNVTVSFTTDEGNRLKSVKLNNTDVTSAVVNNQYIINSIKANTTLEVVFEPIPTYSLNISVAGNGEAEYDGKTIRNQSQSFSLMEGASATIALTPDSGHRIASVMLNGEDVTTQVSNGQFSISSITANTNVAVSFEAIPPTTYSLSITATGNGSVLYDGNSVKSGTSSFNIVEGTNVTVSFTSDEGNRLKSVKLNNLDVTSSVVNNQYTINNIKANTTLEVVFEPIPTYSLNISVSGNGHAEYDGKTIRNQSQSFTLMEGSSATIILTPDSGHRIASVKLNGEDVTAQVSNGQFSISSITANTNVAVSFEAIPPTTYSLSIAVIGNGYVTYDGNTVKGKTSSFTVVEGTNAVVKFTADEGNRLKSVQLDNIDVTSSVVDNQYVIKNIKANTSLEVTFEAIPTYSLNITATGNGSVTYNDTSVRGKTQMFTVSEGTSATVTFAPDADYRIASVMLNNTDVTASVANNSYTINKIIANTTLAVTFEEIPPTTYTFAISAIGNGTVTYDENTIRSKTISFTVIEGTNAIVKFTADEGYRLKSVKLNNIDVTSSVVNNQYSINNIKENMTLEVIFEPIPTYLLNLSASGSGQAEYNGKTIRNQSQSFILMEGASATITLIPDNGYRIASVMLNGEDVTTQVSNGQFSINSITANTNVEVSFEAIPPTSYSFSIAAIGNGYVAYDGNTVRSKTSSFTVIEGTNATVKFSADEGNRLKSVKVDHVDVTSSVTGNQYTIIDIKADISVEVVFEAIPTYSLNIVSSGNGSASYEGVIIRNQSQSFTLQEGSSAVVSFMADAGCRIKSVKVNNNDVTAQVSNGQITIDNITQNTNVEVSFEKIPPTTYSLTIFAVGNGTVVYDSHTVKDQTSLFTVVEGSYITIQIVPDDGYRMKSVTLDGMDVTANVVDGQYTTSKMMANATLIVEFEAIPMYLLTIKSTAFGSVKFGDAVVSNRTETFSIREGASAVLAFVPDDNGRMQRITLNGADITKELVNGQYTIGNIREEQIIEAEFVEDITKVTDAGVAYTVTSYDEQTVIVATGNYGNMLTIPASFSAKGMIWKVVGIDEDALIDNRDLAAVIWKPEVMFDAKISNPNLLLYVKAVQYAASGIQNVVVGDVENVESLVAENIVLTEAESGNDFYCPVPFMAKRISFEHNYSMISGYKTCQGWETIALPFDVSIITNAKGTEIVPYSTWEYGSNLRPFWLYELTAQGWKASNGIKANVPYIISMPNNEMYDSDYNQTGNIRFIGNNVQIVSSDNMTIGQYGNKRLVANYQNQEANADIYALNVSNEWYQNTETEKEGSTFIRSLRAIHPFEAYMTLESGAAAMRAIPIFENDATGISDVQHSLLNVQRDVWYSIDGRKLQGEPKQKGIYIYNGKKVRK